jgi:hypothetical protein
LVADAVKLMKENRPINRNIFFIQGVGSIKEAKKVVSQ